MPDIEEFTNKINQIAEKECKQIAKQTDSFIKKETKQISEEIARDEERDFAFEKLRIKNGVNRQIGEIQNELRLSLSKKREEILNLTFDAVKEKLKAFKESDSYKDFLKSSIKQIDESLISDYDILAKKDDVSMVLTIKEELKLSFDVLECDEIKLGGVIAKKRDGSVFVYDTLESRLDSKRDEFMEKSGLGALEEENG